MSFKERLHSHTPSLGAIISMPDPAVAEIFTQAGFDWLWIDAEHGTLTPGDVQRLAQAAGGCPCLVRVPAIDEMWVKKVLDTGVEGIIFPLVNSAADAEHAVALCRYPPEGRRSVGVGRAHGYGPGFDHYVKNANARTCVIVQIEHIQAVERLDEILATPGLDGALIGPFDLSNSMGKPGQLDDPEVTAAIEQVHRKCMEKGVPVGIFTTSAEYARQALAEGYTFVGAGIDVMILANAARGIVSTIKRP